MLLNKNIFAVKIPSPLPAARQAFVQRGD